MKKKWMHTYHIFEVIFIFEVVFILGVILNFEVLLSKSSNYTIPNLLNSSVAYSLLVALDEFKYHRDKHTYYVCHCVNRMNLRS